MNRRQFLKWSAGAAAAGGAGLGLYSWRFEPHWVEVVERDLTIEHLPAELVGSRLVQISDLHVGAVVDDDYMKNAVAKVSALNPDLLVITGDFVTYQSPRDVDKCLSHLSDLKPARLATIGIAGNHDYGLGCTQPEVARRLEKGLDQLGIRLLRNEIADVAGLSICGLDDLWGGDFQVSRTLRDLPTASASLVLCHNPDGLDYPDWEGYRGWILSGHTHGGQCRFPIVGTPLLPVRNRRYVAGEIPLDDGRRVYINRGLGYLRRVRFQVRPEITVFTLRSASPLLT